MGGEAMLATKTGAALVLAVGLGALAQPVVSNRALPASPADTPRTDRYGDPLPDGVLARLGTVRFRHGFPVNCLSVSPDGKTLASGDMGDTLSVWDLATGKKLFQPSQKDGRGYAVAFSPDGKMLAAGGRDDTITLWDAANWKVKLREFKAPGEGFFSVAFSPDGKTLAGGSLLGAAKGVIHLWDVATGKETGRLEGHQNCVTGLAFSPDGKALASASNDKTARLWDVASGKELHQLKGHPWWVTGVAFGPDGKTVVTASPGSLDKPEPLHVWDVATGREVRQIESPDRWGFRHLAFSPDGKSLVTSGRYSPRLRDWATGKELRQYGAPEDSSNFWGGPVAFTADGKALAVARWSSIQLYTLDGGKPLLPESGHWALVEALAFLRDGRTLVSGGMDGTVRVWDGSTDKELRRLGGPPWVMVGFALSPDGKALATADCKNPDSVLRLLDVDTGKQNREAIKTPGMVRFVSFSSDGRSLVSGGEQEVWVWDAATGNEVRRFGADQGRINSFALSPDGKLLATGGEDSIIRLWDVATGRERRRLEGHQPWAGRGGIYALAFSADGKTLASGGRDWTARLWDADTGKELARFEGHSAPVYALVLSPNGRMLATLSQDRTFRLWEVATRQERRRLEGHQGMAQCLAFRADGKVLASGGNDTAVLLWDATGATRKDRRAARLTAEELKSLWADLAGNNAPQAYAAVGKLVAASAQAVSLLQDNLRPVPPADPKQLARLVDDLGSDEFEKRDKAAKELERLGDAAEPYLRQGLAGKPAAEVRRAVELLLSGLEVRAERVRALRALEVLEYVGTPEAKKLLAELVKGAPEAWLTRQAKATLERLEKQPRP
jgi:WD40 repeat protein